jgi:hypothetical protein
LPSGSANHPDLVGIFRSCEDRPVRNAHRAAVLPTVCVALMLPLAACGGDSSDDAGDEAVTTTATSADATSTGLAPAELVGTYTTTLEKSDVPADAAPELADAGLAWTLRIGNTGGAGDGPFLAIDSDTAGNLEAPPLRVDGDRLLLLDEECAAGGELKFYDNEYRWTLSDGTLKITTDSNNCSDRVAETILTSQSWTKTS